MTAAIDRKFKNWNNTRKLIILLGILIGFCIIFGSALLIQLVTGSLRPTSTNPTPQIDFDGIDRCVWLITLIFGSIIFGYGLYEYKIRLPKWKTHRE